MKKLYVRSLMLLLALTWIIPKAGAQNYTFTLNDPSDWFQTSAETTIPNSKYVQGVGTGGSIYTVPAPTATSDMVTNTYTGGTDYLTRWYVLNSSTSTCGTFASAANGTQFPYTLHPNKTESVSNARYYAGPAVTVDTKGNLYFAALSSTSLPGSYPWAAAVGAVSAFSASNLPTIANPKPTCTTIVLSTSAGGSTAPSTDYAISGRSDLMSGYGDGLGGTGYLWFTVNSGNIERVTLSSGKPTAKTAFTAPVATGTRSYTLQYADNKVVFTKNGYSSSGYTAQDVYKGVISGSSITWTKVGVKSYTPVVTAFTLCDNDLLVYAKSKTQLALYNMTTGAEIVAWTPFGTESTQTYIYFNLNAVVNSNKTATLYMYIPGVGVAQYTITSQAAEEPVANLTATCVKEEDMADPNINKAGRQNACLTWEANPAWGAQPTSYTVQYKRSYTNNAGTLVETDWRDAGTTTTLPTVDNPFVHTDICYYKYNSVNYATTYQYRVIPVFNGANGQEAVSNGVNPEFIPISPTWIWLFGEETYDGLCMTQLYWDYPGYGLKPDSYDILRDGELITEDERVAAFVHVDYNTKAGHTHNYEIRTYYNGLDNSKYALSSVRSATIGARDWSKPKYSVTEIYNFSLQAGQYEIAADAYATNFLTRDCYPQATFKDGKWYISQMYDAKVNKSDYNPGKSTTDDIEDWTNYAAAVAAAGASGGIIVFDGDVQAQSNGKMVGGYRIPNILPRVYQNRGVAIDDAGNMFIRGLRNTTYTTAVYQYWHDFEYMMTTGEVYKANADGTFSSTKYTVDFSAVNFAEMSQDTGGPVEGRCDYFSMKGDVFSTEGAYLYVAPTQTKATYVFNLKAGSGTTITATLVGVYFEHGLNQKTNAQYPSNAENYAFPVNCVGRENQFIHNVRSSIFRNLEINNSGTIQYDEQLWTGSTSSPTYLSNKPYSWNVTGVEGYAPAQPTKNVEGRIYDFHSRVNNCGGATFEFNGELFIVTPISQYSINTGSFYIGRGYRGLDSTTGLRKGPKDADLANVVPVATVYQKDEALSDFSNSAGVWVYGEVPTLESEISHGIAQVDADADGDGKVDYAYIYVYAPAQRFAKYKLMPDALFPPSPNELTVKPVYEPTETNPTSDLVRYDAEVTWAPMEYSYNVPDENGVKTGNYSVYYYTVTLYDYSDPANPVVVGTEKVYVYNAADGTSEDKVVLGPDGKVVNYTTTFPDVPVFDEDGNKIPYVSEVVVTYLGEKGTVAETAGEKNSIETESEDDNSFDTAPPAGEVHIGKTEEWADWNQPYGQKDENDGYWDVYRIELEPTNPQWEEGQVEEPVSCYTINVSGPATENNDATDKEICSFYLYDPDTNPTLDGVQNVTGLEPDAQGYVHVTTCTIPGNYVFNPDDEHPDIYWDERDYTGQTSGENAPADDGKINPEDWTFYVNAVYADSNPQLRTVEEGSMEKGGVPTEVEVIKNESSFRVYPNPATTAINVKSMSGINEVKIYTLAGVEVKAVAANGENHVVILVDDLVEGYYLLKVNNHAPVKVLVK